MESIEYNFFVSVIVVCYTYTVFLIYNMFMTAYESRNGPRTQRAPAYYSMQGPQLPPPQPPQQQPKKVNRVDTINKEIQKQEKILRDLLREKSKETNDGEIIV